VRCVFIKINQTIGSKVINNINQWIWPEWIINLEMNVDSYENKPKLPIIERISKKKIPFLNSLIINQTYVIIPQAWVVVLLDFWSLVYLFQKRLLYYLSFQLFDYDRPWCNNFYIQPDFGNNLLTYLTSSSWVKYICSPFFNI
jgi:hypothetical protein